jgi:hypothetical protein
MSDARTTAVDSVLFCCFANSLGHANSRSSLIDFRKLLRPRKTHKDPRLEYLLHSDLLGNILKAANDGQKAWGHFRRNLVSTYR